MKIAMLMVLLMPIHADARMEAHAMKRVSADPSATEDCRRSETPKCQAVRETRCTAAIDGFIARVSEIDRTAPQADVARGSLVAAFKKRVADNRRAGVKECQTWGELSGMAFNQ
ncbi:MAG: hypothetical protein ABI905_11850 [Betaproteobacteria bacterium]